MEVGIKAAKGGKLPCRTHRHIQRDRNTTRGLTRPEYCMRRSHGPLKSMQTERIWHSHTPTQMNA